MNKSQKNESKKISLIIRSKNEEKWITSCLQSIFRQNYKNFEIIIVDNESTDNTLIKAKKFDVKIVSIKDYSPGKAINKGIRSSEGDYIVITSAHCIAADENWLSNLIRNFDDPTIAGVYGRQEPMAFTSDLDKRDLMNLFGLDRKVQEKDPFFHNANSMIKKSVWKETPFDENVSNIEDRVWAKSVLELGYKIIYDPEASVYHYHGVYHPENEERTRTTMNVLEGLNYKEHSKIALEGINVCAVIPVSGELKKAKDRPLLSYSIESAKNSKYINQIIISTDNNEYKKVAEDNNIEVPFLRPKELSYDHVGLSQVYKYTLDQIANFYELPDLLFLMQETYPFRPPGFIDHLIEATFFGDYDTVIPIKPEYKNCWIKQNGNLKQIDNQGFIPTKFKEPVFLSYLGLGYVTHPKLVFENKKLGSNVGFIEIKNPFSCIELKDKNSLKFFSNLMDNFSLLMGENYSF